MITRGNLERLTQKFINEAFIHMQNEKPTARAEGAPSQDNLTDPFNVSFSASEDYPTGRLLPIPFSHHLILSC